ncbi:MAG: hypothetical protein PHZ19_00315 [Candidatus Thermoplasmatota archaeon]|nr:hypothetical protein [Candidatus Thermoplasmatota archaeon]
MRKNAKAKKGPKPSKCYSCGGPARVGWGKLGSNERLRIIYICPDCFGLIKGDLDAMHKIWFRELKAKNKARRKSRRKRSPPVGVP